MSKFDIKDNFDKQLYRVYNIISDLLFNVNFSAKRVLRKNLVYKDRHLGGRCFILGTGPSLKNITHHELAFLKGEILIGTNSLYKVNSLSDLTPTYYSLLDNLYWEGWSHTFSDVVSKYIHRPPIFITDLRALNFAEKSNPNVSHIAVHSKKYPVEKMSDRLDVNIFAAMNVVSYSILAAMFMGFKEIYLLGCDYNAFCSEGRGHAYNDGAELSQSNYNLAFYLKFYAITTEFHYLIDRLASDRGINVTNLTSGSLLDAYRRGSLQGLIEG
jgi:hypothetical protein